ncbi:Ribbon-helix-helix protein, copG family [Geoglobus ahangari]|uniref:Ribbon-helix-helix protein, copG family n=1 Tax=Geoglobus ahangari TaxID=113653 RepID=A0A0F7IG75_9EURY|nr:ribbon-helix-helix domain-containing protein [Geoglobus ahangari]AKG91593.1 Ribbon-helix-helix protein, copG family [Geoglobus ahangari]
MAAEKRRLVIPVSLPEGLVKELDELVRKKVFSSRSEALRYGARLVVLLEKGVHAEAEDYAYEMIKERLERRVRDVSGH